jgi:hypothetical protein
VRARPQRRHAVSLLAAAALALGATLHCAHADEPSGADPDLPQISVDSGRIEVRRSQLAPEISMSVQGPGPALSAPTQPGRRTIFETTILGRNTETIGGLLPRLRLGYGAGDGASPTTGYSDVFIRGVLIKEFN